MLRTAGVYSMKAAHQQGLSLCFVGGCHSSYMHQHFAFNGYQTIRDLGLQDDSGSSDHGNEWTRPQGNGGNGGEWKITRLTTDNNFHGPHSKILRLTHQQDSYTVHIFTVAPCSSQICMVVRWSLLHKNCHI